MSLVAAVRLHWCCRPCSCFTLTVCTCVLKCASSQTISWVMTIECWHFFESEWQFSEHSKKTHKWVSICTATSLLLKRACLASAKLQMQGTYNSHHCYPLSTRPLFRSLIWFILRLPTCRQTCLNCGSVLCPGPTWLWKDGEQTSPIFLKATEVESKWRHISLHPHSWT